MLDGRLCSTGIRTGLTDTFSGGREASATMSTRLNKSLVDSGPLWCTYKPPLFSTFLTSSTTSQHIQLQLIEHLLYHLLSTLYLFSIFKMPPKNFNAPDPDAKTCDQTFKVHLSNFRVSSFLEKIK
jgi:hypothetical protein